MTHFMPRFHLSPARLTTALAAAMLSLAALPAASDTITGDLTVRNNLCVGLGCANGGVESFGSEELKLKDFTPSLKFEDSSTNPGVATNDWQIRVNANATSFFAIEDIDANSTPFRVDAGARTNALRVTAGGDIGVGTGLPQSTIHMSTGSSPELRFEQDGSQGLQPQSWDMGGNNVGFYIRDVTNQPDPILFNLPFVIYAGMGTSDALVIASDGDIGMGTVNPQAALDLRGQSMLISNEGRVNFTLSDTSDAGPDFRTQLSSGSARFSFVGTGKIEMELEQTGDLKIAGNYLSSGTQLNVPDYVFSDDYALRPLAEVQRFIDTHSHLPEVPSAAQIATEGLDMSEMQMTLLKKIEELTLYTLAQQETIAAQNAKLAEMDALKRALTRVTARLDALETD